MVYLKNILFDLSNNFTDVRMITFDRGRNLAIKYFKIYALLVFLMLMSILIGVRILGQDSDFLTYSNFYDNLTDSLSYSGSRYEYGFVTLSYIFKNILDASIYVFFSFLAFLSLSIKAFLLFKNKNTFLILIIYMLSFGLLHEMTQIRVALAVSVVLLSFYFKCKDKFYTSIIFFILSLTLHYSMFFFALALFIPNRWLIEDKINAPSIFFYTLSAALVLYFTKDIFIANIKMLQVYANRASDETFNYISVRFLGLIAPLIFGVYSFNDFNAFQKRCFIISLMSYMMTVPASFIPTLASRLFELGWLCFYFWVGGISEGFKKRISILFLVAVSIYFAVRNIYLEPIFNI